MQEVVNFVPLTVMHASGGTACIASPFSSKVETDQVPFSESRSLVFFAPAMSLAPEKLYSEQDAVCRCGGNVATCCRDLTPSRKDRSVGRTSTPARRGRGRDRRVDSLRLHAAGTHRHRM